MHRRRLGLVILLVASLGSVGAAGTVGPSDGVNLAGWELVTNPPAAIGASCRVTAGGVIEVTGKPVGYLLTPGSHGNYRLHVEYRWPAGAARDSNGGVLVHVASGPVDRNTWPVSFQIQTKVGRAGDVLPMAGAKFAEPLSSAPGARTPLIARTGIAADKALGEWNSIDILCRDGTIRVSVNGVGANQVTHCVPDSGRVGIQLEGYPFELRNLSLTAAD